MKMYEDLNLENIKDYVVERTGFFTSTDHLQVYEFGTSEEDGDGFVNFLYRVWEDGGNSVIVKQAKPYLRMIDGIGENTPFVQSRNAMEASIMRIRGAITPEYIPEIYDVDKKNNIFICEDCGDLKIMRMELIKGKVYPNIPKSLGEFIAKSNFYTSEIYLSPEKHRELQEAYMNSKMRKVFETSLFLKDEHFTEDMESEDFFEKDPIRIEMGDMAWASRELRVELLKLRHSHMKKAEVLVHGDLHTSNVMVGENAMKIIDMEYTYMGPASADSGYLMGSILYEYIRWFYVPDVSPERCEKIRLAVLKTMKGVIDSYFETFTKCFKEDARSTYKGYDEYCQYLLDVYFHEMVGYTGCQILSRVGHVVPLVDFDSIDDKQDHYEACRISLIIANHLVIHRNEIKNIDEMIEVIVKITEQSRAAFDLLK